MAFDGFRPAALRWFAGLEADNTREWFHAHRADYDGAVRGPLGELLEELAEGRAVWLARPNRDTRFSHDKSPYKTRAYGTVGGRFYAELSGDGLFAGTGAYGMDAGQLARFRAALDDDGSGGELVSLLGAVHAAGLESWGEALKTAPRGYPKDHPRVALLRHKMLVAGARVKPRRGGGLSRDVALSHLRETWAACGPLLGWLDAHVGEPAEPRRR